MRTASFRWSPRAAADAALALVLALSPPQQVIAQAAAQALAASPEEVIVSVHANGVAQGEFTLLRAPDGDFWIRADDLPRLDLGAMPQARRAFGEQAWYSARALGAGTLRFDESTLTLHVDFRADTLAGTRIDLSRRDAPLVREAALDSLVLSYRLSAIQPSNGNLQATMASDLNVRLGGLLLRQEMVLDTSGPGKGVRRGVTQVIHDDLQNARRLAVGDVVSHAGPYGSTITGAGVLLAKVYDLAPDLVRQPAAHLQATTTLPADVEVSVDGSTVYRGRVAPGPIAIDNLLVHGGTRNVRVVVTDVAGRRQVIEQPFLFTDTVLARGLHEYSYFAGRRSQFDDASRWRYREAAWQAFHRYGLTDSVTVAAGGEGNEDFHNVGAGITLRSDRLGLIALDRLQSRNRAAGTTAHGWSARYTWLSPVGSVVLGRRVFDPGFRTFDKGGESPFPRSETRLGVAGNVGRLSLSADFVRRVTQLDVRDTALLRAATSLAPGLWLLGDWQATRIDGRKGWVANVYLRADIDAQRWVSTAMRAEPEHRRVESEAGKQLPDGEGTGYRLGMATSWERGEPGSHTIAWGGHEWNLRRANVGVFATAPVHGNGPTYLQAEVAGALVGVGGYWGLTRQITDSFILARLGVPQPGVEVLLNNEPQGRTDAQGRLLIPRVSSFGRQELSVNEQDLGIQYALDQRQRSVAPAYRSGSVVDFGIKRMRALAGMAWLVEGGKRTPIAARAWTMRSGGTQLAIETASSGDFYLEDAPPGRYTGTLQGRGRTHACRMTVPAFEEAVHELKEGIVCE